MINAIVKQIPQNSGQIGEFKLISKVKRACISEIEKSKHWKAPQEAVSFDYVEIGKISDENFSKEVISFYDENGRLILKNFRENGKNTRQRTYQYIENKKIISDMFFDTSRIKEKVDDILFNIGGIWKKAYEETQWITKIPEWAKKGKNPTELHTRRVDYNPITELEDQITLTQYPINLGLSKRKKQFVSGIFKHTTGVPMLKEITYSTNNRLDFYNDKYLKYRFFDFHRPEGVTVFTKGLLDDNGLGNLKIKVFPDSPKVKSDSAGYFDPLEREICYSKNLSKPDLYVLDIVDSVAHEVEHAKQFSLIGRRGNGSCEYEFDAFSKLGELKTPEEQMEALKYFIAKGDYCAKGDKYTNNYLEVKAREAGARIAEEFQFPIENFIFFERFN